MTTDTTAIYVSYYTSEDHLGGRHRQPQDGTWSVYREWYELSDSSGCKHCDHDQGEHYVDSLFCPIYSDKDNDVLVGFSHTTVFEWDLNQDPVDGSQQWICTARNQQEADSIARAMFLAYGGERP